MPPNNNHGHLQIIPRFEVAPGDWDSFANCSDEAWYWHQGNAIDSYATWKGATDLSFAIKNKADGNRIVATVPLIKASIRVPGFTRLESTGGPALCNKLSLREVSNLAAMIEDHLIAQGRKHRALYIDMSMAPLAPAFRSAIYPFLNPLEKFGLKDTSTRSWIVPMQNRSEEELWKNLAQRTRKSINKAIKAGYTARLATMADLPHYLALHRETALRNNLPIKPESYARNILSDTKGSSVFIAEKEGQVVAFHAFAVFKHAAIYRTTGCSKQALAKGANNFLMWESMKVLHVNGVDWLECGESLAYSTSQKLQKINEFKRSFGGILFPYFRGRKIQYPVVHALLELARTVVLKFR